MIYSYLGPWTSGGVELGWVGPAGTLVASDLRPAEQQARPDGTPGIGLFVTDRKLGSDYDLLASGDPREAKVSARARNAWKRLVGASDVQGATPAELLHHQLTWGADPTGADCPPPLMPEQERDGRSFLRLHLLGVAAERRFRWGEDPAATARVKAVLRRDFARTMRDAGEGRTRDPEQHRKVLGYLMRQHGVQDWREFVAPELRADVPGPKEPATTYDDDFDRSDSASLGSPWEEMVADLAIRSNRLATASGNTNDNPRVRYNADLSSANHYTQIQAVSEGSSGSFPQNVYFGALVRYASAADTFYDYWQRRSTSTGRALQKCVTGAFTTLQSDNTGATVPYAVKLEANGSALTCYTAGAETLSTTDTSITGNLRGGAQLRGGGDAVISGNQALDDWITEDLAAVTHTLVTLENVVNRGTFRGLMFGRFT